jgi:flagellar hook-associated protein FlgK
MPISALGSARSALEAFGTLLDVTAGNIANLHTEGYTSRRVVLSEATSAPGAAGSGAAAPARGVEAHVEAGGPGVALASEMPTCARSRPPTTPRNR